MVFTVVPTHLRPSAHLRLRPLHTYPYNFEKEFFFRRTQRIQIVFTHPHENIKTMEKYDSIPYGACVTLKVYDAWHHRIWKLPFSSVHT